MRLIDNCFFTIDGQYLIYSNGSFQDVTSYMPTVNVAIDGSDVYLKGFTHYLPEAWIKGTLSEDGKSITFPGDQYFGSYDDGPYAHYEFYLLPEGVTFTYDAEAGKMTAMAGRYGNMDYYITAVDAAGNMVDAVLNFDGEKWQFTTDQKIAINGSLTELNILQSFTNMTITKFIEVAAMPAAPSVVSVDFDEWSSSVTCLIPAVGTNGETLNPKKQFYTVWIEKDGHQRG